MTAGATDKKGNGCLKAVLIVGAIIFVLGIGTSSCSPSSSTRASTR